MPDLDPLCYKFNSLLNFAHRMQRYWAQRNLSPIFLELLWSSLEIPNLKLHGSSRPPKLSNYTIVKLPNV